MSALDFMFQGQAPAQGTNYSQNQSNVPTWLQDYTQGVLAQANSLAAQPYQTYGGPRIAGQTGAQTNAAQTVQNLQGQYQPTLNQAQNLATASANPSAITGALGTLQGAMSPTAASMNPYTQNVIQKAEDQASQYWKNQLLPSIDQQYAASGQAGSSANTRALGEAGAQVTQNIQDTSNAALSQAFQQAQQTGLQGAQIGGGLGYEQGVLGLQGASALGSLAGQGQQMGLQGAGALDTVGQEQQQQQQQNLNLGYQDFLNQQQYPYQQASWMSQMLSGTANPTNTPGMSQGSQTSYTPSTGASPLSQAIGVYSGLNSGQVGSALGGGARGGPVHRFVRPRHSALEHLRRAA